MRSGPWTMMVVRLYGLASLFLKTRQMKKPLLYFVLLLFNSLNGNAQKVAVSEKIKSYFHVPLSMSDKTILVLNYEKGDLKLESWNKALTTKTLVAEIDLSQLNDLGE